MGEVQGEEEGVANGHAVESKDKPMELVLYFWQPLR